MESLGNRVATPLGVTFILSNSVITALMLMLADTGSKLNKNATKGNLKTKNY